MQLDPKSRSVRHAGTRACASINPSISHLGQATSSSSRITARMRWPFDDSTRLAFRGYSAHPPVHPHLIQQAIVFLSLWNFQSCTYFCHNHLSSYLSSSSREEAESQPLILPFSLTENGQQRRETTLHEQPHKTPDRSPFPINASIAKYQEHMSPRWPFACSSTNPQPYQHQQQND